MTDIIGITSALDHIIYMTLNVIATLLWRLDAAIIGMSLYSYGTQDWLPEMAAAFGAFWNGSSDRD
jgi:hypothetical protein